MRRLINREGETPSGESNRPCRTGKEYRGRCGIRSPKELFGMHRWRISVLFVKIVEIPLTECKTIISLV